MNSMEYVREEAAFWALSLVSTFFPCVSSSVIKGPLAVMVLLTTVVDAGLLEGVPEAVELIRGLLELPVV